MSEIRKLKHQLKVEKSLDRVRNLALKMKDTKDLSKVIALLFAEMAKLGFNLLDSNIGILDNKTKDLTYYGSGLGGVDMPPGFTIPYLPGESPYIDAVYRDLKKRGTFNSFEFSGMELDAIKDFYVTKTGFGQAPKEYIEGMLAPEYLVLSYTTMKFGVLEVGGIEKLDAIKIDILKRFTKVLELTYTRFYDLQKAEKQAREAQVEAALERLRAASMAMHKSEELPNVALAFLTQVEQLGIPVLGVALNVLNKKQETGISYFADNTGKGGKQEIKNTREIDLNSFWISQKVLQQTKTGEKEFTILAKGKQVLAWIDWVDEIISHERAMRLRSANLKKVYFQNHIFHDYSGVLFSSLEVLSEEDKGILRRLVTTFGMSYKRFLDLQKAEAQAREAQIETSLERIRATAMAMHKSDEITKVAKILNNELQLLGITQTATCGFVILDEKEKLQHYYGSHAGKNFLKYFRFPLMGDNILKERYESWKGRDPVFIQVAGGKKLQKHLSVVIPDSETTDAERISKQDMPDPTHFYLGNFEQGYLQIIASEILRNEQVSLLPRFATVFEQAYTRFLDLKKAEAQAREAQIEAALERVRARSMGMHKSQELKEVIQVVYEQLSGLNIFIEHTGFIMDYKSRDDMHIWLADKHGAPSEIMIPYFDSPHWNSFIKARKEGNDFFANNLDYKEKNKFYKKLFKHIPDLPEEAKSNYFSCPGLSISTVLLDNVGLYMENFSGIPYSDEDNKTLIRFGKVFQQTYTRFQDLQRAEAQAREARIEAALERVRARAMAMHKTDELREAGGVLYQELAKLGFINLTSAYGLMDADHKTVWYYYASPEDGAIMAEPMGTPCTETKPMRSITKSWRYQEPYHIVELDQKETIDHQTFIAERSSNFPFSAKELISLSPAELKLYTFNFKQGYLLTVGGEKLGTDQIDIMLRFTKVFEMTYRRFLDLQKAEEQVREAQIEAALERVRARAMAMHSSEELGDAAVQLYGEFMGLGVTDFFNCGYVEVDEKSKIQYAWMTHPDGTRLGGMRLPLEGDAIFRQRYKSWKSKERVFSQKVSGQALKDHLAMAMKDAGSDEASDMVNNLFPESACFYCGNFSHGYLHIISENELSYEAKSLLARFTAAFEMTYMRFLDLKKAEAQAREAQIETALERIRARALAMHDSKELEDVVRVMREQMVLLGQSQLETIAVHLYPEDGDDFESWYAVRSAHKMQGKILTGTTRFSKTDTAIARKIVSLFHSDQSEYIFEFRGKLLDEWQNMVVNHIPGIKEDWGNHAPQKQYWYFVDFSGGSFVLIPREEPNEEAKELLRRSALVFDLAYKRYKDLQKAEAQAREAEIETSLERVRSKTMAMHNSEDVAETVTLLFDELVKLGYDDHARCGVGILNGSSHHMELWTASTENDGKAVLSVGKLDMTLHPLLVGIREAWMKKKEGFSYIQKGKDLRNYYSIINQVDEYPYHFDLDKLPKRLYHHNFTFADGILYTFTRSPLSEEMSAIFRRFANIFGQTYRRYQDLVKAEAQAREAQIESALERIRARALAMHSSEELIDVAKVLREQMYELDQPELAGCVIHLYPEGSEFFESWFAFKPNNQKSIVTGSVRFPRQEIWLTREWIRLYESQKTEYSMKVSGKDYKEWIKLRNKSIGPQYFKAKNNKTANFYYCTDFSGGTLITSASQEVSEGVKKLQKRAASVFDLAYKRYLDLQQAEAREKEAIRQASLDRIRGEIASMRSREDLLRITPIIWQELTQLKVPFIRCGVMIMDEEREVIQSYLSTPDGKTMGIFDLPFSAERIGLGGVAGWRKQEVFRDHWNKDEFEAFYLNLKEQGKIENPVSYKGGATPESLDLHFIPFKQGMLYVGNTDPLSDEQVDLVKTLADAFSIAYARYEDFNQLEVAKNKIENTLSELKSTQSQLIHAEKMASLGELTAGIAHEIQNPLNFVNNFSEVSVDLIGELKEEIEKIRGHDANGFMVETLDDIVNNLKKINHHGHRASSIVKGMLEHSRSGSKEKELTDINVLADEYLRLAYHGLRAKDKSFHANFHLDIDKNLPKIKVISQDIGRVLLNLINNAFYVVSKKSKEGPAGYSPEVRLSTKRMKDMIEIRVKDNGNGIPMQVRDKIFQPFFTTKPTGEGTGLGLSLSYDIITKGHDGTLEVETADGKGSEFTVRLPIRNTG